MKLPFPYLFYYFNCVKVETYSKPQRQAKCKQYVCDLVKLHWNLVSFDCVTLIWQRKRLEKVENRRQSSVQTMIVALANRSGFRYSIEPITWVHQVVDEPIKWLNQVTLAAGSKRGKVWVSIVSFAWLAVNVILAVVLKCTLEIVARYFHLWNYHLRC